MMNFRNAVAGLGVLAATTLGAGAAMAATPAYVTISLNLRAGPGTDYPVVATMAAGSGVTIYGCLSGWSWCDIGWDGYRGWAAGSYLQVLYQQRRYPIYSYGYRVRVPFITFNIGTYWDRHYHHRRFYRDMSRYRHFYQGGTNQRYNGSTTVNRNTTTTIRRYNNAPSTMTQQHNTTRHYTTSPNVRMNSHDNMQTNHQYHMKGQANGNLNQRYQGPSNLTRHDNRSQRKIYKCKPGQQMVNGACQ
jgi:uncharacterized protein YraI